MTPLRCLPSLTERSVNPERMDDPRLDANEHDRALRGLARLNAVGRAVPMLWPLVRREIERADGDRARLSLLDVACGRGDLLRGLHRRARGRLDCRGVDLSETALTCARRLAPPDIVLEQRDALADPLPPADIVVCSLFLHHLGEADCVALLRRLANATRRLLLISDLERGPFAYVGVSLFSRIVTRSPVVHGDGALSVRAAFTSAELETMARRAGLDSARVVRHFPCRLILAWRPSPE